MPSRTVNADRGSTERTTRARRTEAGSRDGVSLLQQRAGNRATGLLLQAKLRIGAPNDRYEQEADRVADVVMRSARPGAPALTAVGPGSVIQRCSCGGACPSCAAKDEEMMVQRLAITPVAPNLLQREATETCKLDEEASKEEAEEEVEEAGATGEAIPPAAEETTVDRKARTDAPPSIDEVEAGIDAARGQGRPLPVGARELMESRFGYDFSRVRVHTGAAAHRLNRDLNSHAFATGADIFFAPGQFRPGTDAGNHLLAHELTHVVQQSGGAAGGVVREKAAPGTVARKATDWEDKDYYRWRVGGTLVHHRVEELLLGANKDGLVTEAAIPGANRHGPALNKVGVADLYKSDPPLTVAGVKAYRDAATEADIVSMNAPSKIGTRPAVTSRPTIGGPTKGPRTWNGQFPRTVWLGELKPLSPMLAGMGMFQLDSYRTGYQTFVARINTLSGGSTGAGITFHDLTVTLPAQLNFDNWDAQHATAFKPATFGTRRIWVASVGRGLYVYVDLASSLRGAAPESFVTEITRLREIRQDLGKKNVQRTEPMASAKFRPGGPRLSALPRPGGASATRHVQRATKDRPANYWSEQGRIWEEKRSTWGKKFRAGLKAEHRAHREKLRFEQRLGSLGKKAGASGRKAGAKEAQRVKDYRQLVFWSGYKGRFVGKLRFLLGSAWDKIIGVFERMKTRMSGVRDKVKGISEKGFNLGGWQKKLITVLVAAAKIAGASFITQSFNFFVSCFHSAMDKVVDKFEKQLEETVPEPLVAKLCQARLQFEASKERLEAEWGTSITKIEELVKVINDVKYWTQIASAAITTIRLIVQAISCLTPPALGCLWGLVAQIGISAGLSLIIGTRQFNDKIVAPAMKSLVDKYATKHYQALINRVLGDGLKEYHCDLADKPFDDVDLGVRELVSDADLRAHRDAWEAKNQDAIVADLAKIFQGEKGRRLSKDEVKELVERLKKLKAEGKTDDEIKAMLEAARDPRTGRLKAPAAKANLDRGEAPVAPAKVRTLDYAKATVKNPEWQRKLGWNTLTFYKKPGVAADSEEFAEFIYDMQEVFKLPADGICGPETVTRFYERNKLKTDKAYDNAARVMAERTAAREKAAAAKAAKAQAAKEKKEGKGLQPPAVVVLDGQDYPIVEEATKSLPRGGIVPRILDWSTEHGKSAPAFITVDLYVDGVHRFRVKNVRVRDANSFVILAVPRNVRIIVYYLAPGLQLTIDDTTVYWRQFSVNVWAE